MTRQITTFDSKELYDEMTSNWPQKSYEMQARRWRKLLRNQAD